MRLLRVENLCKIYGNGENIAIQSNGIISIEDGKIFNEEVKKS